MTGREGTVQGDPQATAAQPFAQAARDPDLLGEEHGARVRGPPEDGVARAEPGEDAVAVGVEQPLRAEVAADGEQAVGVAQGAGGRPGRRRGVTGWRAAGSWLNRSRSGMGPGVLAVRDRGCGRASPSR